MSTVSELGLQVTLSFLEPLRALLGNVWALGAVFFEACLFLGKL